MVRRDAHRQNQERLRQAQPERFLTESLESVVRKTIREELRRG